MTAESADDTADTSAPATAPQTARHDRGERPGRVGATGAGAVARNEEAERHLRIASALAGDFPQE